jgi:hypothetical protein
MQAAKTRLGRLEQKVLPEQLPRLIVLNPGETQADAILRLGLAVDALEKERLERRKIIWIRWAG